MRKILTLILALTLIFVLSACKKSGGQLDSSSDKQANTSSSNVQDDNLNNSSNQNNNANQDAQTGFDVVIDLGDEFFD